MDNLPKNKNIPILNPAVKKRLVSELSYNTKQLTKLSNDLSNTLTYITSINSFIKNIQESNDIDTYTKGKEKKPTNADIQKGILFKAFMI